MGCGASTLGAMDRARGGRILGEARVEGRTSPPGEPYPAAWVHLTRLEDSSETDNRVLVWVFAAESEEMRQRRAQVRLKCAAGAGAQWREWSGSDYMGGGWWKSTASWPVDDLQYDAAQYSHCLEIERVDLQPNRPFNLDQGVEEYPVPVLLKLRHQLDLKNATLKYVVASVHLSNHNDESSFTQEVDRLRYEVADLESKIAHLRQRAKDGVMPWHARPAVADGPADTNYLTGQSVLYTDAVGAARSPLIMPEEQDSGDRHARPMDFGSGVQLKPTDVDKAQRRAATNLIERAEASEALALAQRRGGVRVVLQPGTQPNFILVQTILPWSDGSQGREHAVVADLAESSPEWKAGLREGMVLAAVQDEYLVGPFWRQYMKVMAKVESVIEVAMVAVEEARAALKAQAVQSALAGGALEQLALTNSQPDPEPETKIQLTYKFTGDGIPEAVEVPICDPSIEQIRQKRQKRQSKKDRQKKQSEARGARTLMGSLAIRLHHTEQLEEEDSSSEESDIDEVQSEEIPLFFLVPEQVVREEEAEAARQLGAAEKREARKAAHLAKLDALAKAEWQEELARQAERAAKRVEREREAAAAAAAAESARFMAGDAVTLAEGAAPEVVSNGVLRPELRSGAIVTAATVGLIAIVDNPWERPQRLRRQIEARQATIDELTKERLVSATYPIVQEKEALQRDLALMLAGMAESSAMVTYRVHDPVGKASWYRDEDLKAATEEQMHASTAKEEAIEGRAMGLLGFLDMNSGTGTAAADSAIDRNIEGSKESDSTVGKTSTTKARKGLEGYEHSRRLEALGVAKPPSFFGVSRRHEEAQAARAAGVQVLSAAGAPCGRVSEGQRTVLLREELALGIDGWGRAIRLLTDQDTGGGERELTAVLAVLSERSLAGKEWALHFYAGPGAEWAAGRWVRALRRIQAQPGIPLEKRQKQQQQQQQQQLVRADDSINGNQSGGQGEDEEVVAYGIGLEEGAMLRLSHGPPNKWFRGTTPDGRAGAVPSADVEILQKALAIRDFEPLPGSDRSLYTRFDEGAVVVLTSCEPGKKWWEGFILDRDGVEVIERCLDSRKRIALKLLPSAALQLEEAAAAAAAQEHKPGRVYAAGIRWAQTEPGLAQLERNKATAEALVAEAVHAAEHELELQLQGVHERLLEAEQQAAAEVAAEEEARVRAERLRAQWDRDCEVVRAGKLDKQKTLAKLETELSTDAGLVLAQHDAAEAASEAATLEVEAECARECTAMNGRLRLLSVEPEDVHSRLKVLGKQLALIGPGADPDDAVATADATAELNSLSMMELQKRAKASGLSERKILRTLDDTADLQGVIRMETRISYLKLEAQDVEIKSLDEFRRKRAVAAEAANFKDAARWGREVQTLEAELAEGAKEISELEEKLATTNRTNKLGLLEAVLQKQAENGATRTAVREEAALLRGVLATRQANIDAANERVAQAQAKAGKARSLRTREANAARRKRLPLAERVERLDLQAKGLKAAIARCDEALTDKDPMRRLLQGVATDIRLGASPSGNGGGAKKVLGLSGLVSSSKVWGLAPSWHKA